MEQALALGVADVARLLSCSERHVYRLVHAGELPTLPHMGSRLLVPRQAVEDLITQALRPSDDIRCNPCWMQAHRQCTGGRCGCADPIHNESDGPVHEHRAIEERGRLTAAEQAG